MPDVVKDMVSTIIPVHNRPQMLREAVASVLAQTHRQIEIIISDDGSTDDTPGEADDLAVAHPEIVRVIHGPHQGPGPTREAGRQLARGEFIQYLDSDDLLMPRKFQVQVRALREHPECGVAYGYTRHVIQGREPADEPFKWTGRELPTLFPWLLVDRWWCTETPLYRRCVCDAAGPWSDLMWSQDWELDGRIGAMGVKLIQCKEFVSEHREHAGLRQTGVSPWADLLRVKERKRLLGMMLGHAKRAGMTPQYPEMQHFSRWLFMFARRCGAVGQAQDARECFQWAREAAGPERSRGMDFRIYSAAAKVLGWRLAGKLSCRLERLRGRKAGGATMKQSWMEE